MNKNGTFYGFGKRKSRLAKRKKRARPDKGELNKCYKLSDKLLKIALSEEKLRNKHSTAGRSAKSVVR